MITRNLLLSARGPGPLETRRADAPTSRPAGLFLTGQALRLRSGQAALSLVFLVGGIIIVVGVTLAFLSFSFINSSFGVQSAQRAEAVATGGARDALIQLARNTNFSSVGYSVPIGTDQAAVTVTQGAPTASQATITSIATIMNYTRRAQVIVAVNASTGQVGVLSWNFY